MTNVSALSLDQLQQENARLLALIGQQEQTSLQQKSSIETLQHHLHLFRTARFGRKSEKGVVAEQLALQFDEAIPMSEPVSNETSSRETITYTRSKKGTGRKALPKPLPYLEKIHDLNDAEKKYACKSCEESIRLAPLPRQPLPKSIATPWFISSSYRFQI